MANNSVTLYPSIVMDAVRSCLNEKFNAKTKDEIIAQMGKREVLTYCLENEGIIGYTGKILSYVNAIYDTELE